MYLCAPAQHLAEQLEPTIPRRDTKLNDALFERLNLIKQVTVVMAVAMAKAVALALAKAMAIAGHGWPGYGELLPTSKQDGWPCLSPMP